MSMLKHTVGIMQIVLFTTKIWPIPNHAFVDSVSTNVHNNNHISPLSASFVYIFAANKNCQELITNRTQIGAQSAHICPAHNDEPGHAHKRRPTAPFATTTALNTYPIKLNLIGAHAHRASDGSMD